MDIYSLLNNSSLLPRSDYFSRNTMAAHHRDVEVNHNSNSLDEKVDDGQDIRLERSESLVSLPDPDAGKSDAERAKIVRLTPHLLGDLSLTRFRIAH